jgi:hypothetical protein
MNSAATLPLLRGRHAQRDPEIIHLSVTRTRAAVLPTLRVKGASLVMKGRNQEVLHLT